HKNLALDDLLWIDAGWPDQALIARAEPWAPHHVWSDLWIQTSKQSGGGPRQHWIPETLRRIKRLIPSELSVFAIAIDRQAGHETAAETKEAAKVLSGKGVIRALASMQNPGHAKYDEDRKKFREIEEFVRIVTDDTSASISVPHTQMEILVQLKGQRFFPL